MIRTRQFPFGLSHGQYGKSWWVGEISNMFDVLMTLQVKLGTPNRHYNQNKQWGWGGVGGGGSS